MIRVVRQLIYEYANQSVADWDMAKWKQGETHYGLGCPYLKMTSRVASQLADEPTTPDDLITMGLGPSDE